MSSNETSETTPLLAENLDEIQYETRDNDNNSILNSLPHILKKNTTSYSTSSPLFVNNVNITSDNFDDPNYKSKCFSLQKLWKFTGPGLLISVAFLDPGNLDNDLQVGAIAGYKLLWVLLYSTLASYLIQLLSVRLGSVTGFHLAEICQREYGLLTRYFLWLMIEISIIASDIQQVIGSALALNILSNGYITMWVAILITVSDVFLFLLLETRGIRVLEAIFALFISVMGISFLYMFIRAAPDQLAIIKGIFYPWCENCSGPELNQLVGIIGAIVMPHNLFFHSTLVLSRNFDRSNEASVKEANKYYAIESGLALLVAFILNLFVTTVSAKSFNGTKEAANVTLFNSASFINEHYGLTMKIIWAIGLLSAGQTSTITGTYAGQFIMQGLTKINLTRWKRIIVTRSISIVPCVVISLLTVDSIVHLNFWCNIIKAIQIPFALLPILHFTSSRRIMGSFRNNILMKLVFYFISACVLSINVYFIIKLIVETKRLWSYLLGSALVVYIFFVCFFLLFRRLFCSYNVEEIDELLHSNPVYKRPEKKRPLLTNQQAQTSYSSATTTSPLNSNSIKKLKTFTDSTDYTPPTIA